MRTNGWVTSQERKSNTELSASNNTKSQQHVGNILKIKKVRAANNNPENVTAGTLTRNDL